MLLKTNDKMNVEQETVYGTQEDSHVVMSEKVQSLAGSIYQEFERMITRYDEEVVKDLMPLVVNVLECLDLAYTENQEHEVELELLREDNEQLVTQYEREKQLRKSSEGRILELEDAGEEALKDAVGKVESLESIVRMLELKTKNTSDHASRLEEKEGEMKKEYSKLHERYTELFKTHMDYMERTKILMGTDRLEHLGGSRSRIPSMNLNLTAPGYTRSSGPTSFGFSSLEPPSSLVGGKSPVGTPGYGGKGTGTSLHNELRTQETGTTMENIEGTPPGQGHKETQDRGQLTDPITREHRSTDTSMCDYRSVGEWGGGDLHRMIPDTPEMEEEPPLKNATMTGSITTKESRDANNLYQELKFQEPETSMDDAADITGMGKEVENLIMENNELLATKNALNIVKDDLIAKVDELTSEQEILREEITSLQAVKSRMRLRIQELEDELKRVKEEAESHAKGAKSDDEQEEVPMAQRKRFTRVEMARVLMERNQYKERFMELQEAVRWTEMIRASRSDPNIDKKSNKSIWTFFSKLFSSAEKPQRRPFPYGGNMSYSSSTHHVTPAVDSLRRRHAQNRKGLDFLDADITSERMQAKRASERREQYRAVRAHVRKDDGRMQAYGWSLPAKVSTQSPHTPRTPNTPSSSAQVPVPVPVYCRPLMEKEPGMKIWCAAGVNLTGGRTRDGGNIVGASVFYSDLPSTSSDPKDELERLDQELKEGEELRKECESMEQSLSSLTWICTSTHAVSKVTVIDANNPADILDSFHVCSSHLLCIASVPGAKESDYPVDDELIRLMDGSENRIPAGEEEEEGEESEAGKDQEKGEGLVGKITFVSCATGSKPPSEVTSPQEVEEESPKIRKQTATPDKAGSIVEDSGGTTEAQEDSIPEGLVNNLEHFMAYTKEATETEQSVENDDQGTQRRLMKEPTGVIKDGISQLPKDNEPVYEAMERMSSVLPTMWLGSQSGNIYVHSSVAQWRHCLHSIKLRDSVLSIVHVKGRVLAALADGTVAVFHRALDGQWELTNYHLLDLGKPHHSIRCMTVVHDKVWCGYRNRIHIVDPKGIFVEKTIDAHPRKESQVRQMTWLGDGVWVSIRLDSTLRLYHAHTYQHLQDVDIEPYVSKMLGTGKLGFSFVRITALLISCTRLWIGTGNGVIISVPLSESGKSSMLGGSSSSSSGRLPGGVVRVYADSKDKVTPASFVPYCSMAQAQLSFHGHRDAVKFFVAVPGSGGMSAASLISSNNKSPSNSAEVKSATKPKSMLVVSGGEGYIDFRIVDDTDDMDWASHLIVWQLSDTGATVECAVEQGTSLPSTPSTPR